MQRIVLCFKVIKNTMSSTSSVSSIFSIVPVLTGFFPCKHQKIRVKNAKLVVFDLNGKKLREHKCEDENRVSDLSQTKLALVFVLGSKALSYRDDDEDKHVTNLNLA